MILKFMYFGFVACTLVVLLPGVWCDEGDQCMENELANCTSSAENQTEYACINNTCILKNGYNETCNLPTQPCLAPLVCSEGRCGCNTTEYYSNSSKGCEKKNGYNETCNLPTQPCLAPLVCSEGRCGCNTTEYYSNSSKGCEKKNGYNETCNLPTQPCLAPLVCSEGRCGCNTTEYYSNSSKGCEKKPGYGENCIATPDNCNVGNGSCFTNDTSSTCRCNEIFYRHDNQCEPEPGYGENCIATPDNCNVGNGSCFTNDTSSTCRCNEIFYRHDNQCEPVLALQPSGFAVNATTAESIRLSWSVSSNNVIKEFIISENGIYFKNTTINGTTTAITIPGLRPGTRYDNLTVIAIVNTDRGNVPVMSETISDTTNPGKAGKIKTNKTETTINISFLSPSEGEVDYYLVSVSSNSMVFNVSIPNLSLNASTLESGQSYNINITTYYYNKPGEVSMQTFTIPSGYGENCILSSDSCTVINSSCYDDGNSTRCRCNTSFYTDNKQCKSVVSLKPKHLAVTATTAESITLSWNVSRSDVTKEFITSAVGMNIKTTPMDETMFKTTIPGLRPGTRYDNLTVTAIVNTDRGEVSVMSETISDTTNPSKAGSLSPYNIYDTTKTMNISFEQPRYGVVDEYRVNIGRRGLEVDINQTAKIASITISPKTLLPETQYTITIITYYNKRAGEVSKQTFKTMAVPPETPVVAIVVSIIVILLVILIIIGAIIWYRRRRTSHNTENSIRMREVTMATNPIKLKDFSFHLKTMAKDEGLQFLSEFEDIAECSPDYPKEVAKLEIIGPKNRYMDILPFDKTRVKLTTIDEDKTTDYINANFIRGYTSDIEYIAAQGPLAETVDTFWRMIWEHNVYIIVMLSNFEEDGRPKVYRYYSDNGNPTQYGSISVKLQQKSNFYATGNPENTFQVQTFEIRKDNEERTVRHFFLPGWVDFGANLDPADVLEFIQRVRQEINPVSQRPLLVHCSAGVGRTGTYIALDILQQHINRLDMSEEIDIPDLVVRLRCCRCRMVQSLKQYMFIHYAVNEIIENKLGNRTNHAAGTPWLNGQTTQYYCVDNGLPTPDQNTDGHSLMVTGSGPDNVKTEDVKTEKPSDQGVNTEKPSDQELTTDKPSEPEVTTEKADKQVEESSTLQDRPKVTYINIGDRVSLITKSTETDRNNDSSVPDNHFHDNPTFVAEDDIKLNMETETSVPGV
ncbi:receptor-type tyrosine-protein phosphatase H [Patella vulgata]|uniref:receptor-type tyrosine-protein phosphatase H n=1 Tax=Patella vulgata TaxID=6465 RepID=UPI002180067E|nr:receptor-type tyrosine-protein phosphatase H [Patella vulgata]